MRWRALVAVVGGLLAAAPAQAWTRPADGPVPRPVSLSPPDPYAGGQHRALDVAGAAGGPVRAPAAGTVTFAGSVPGGGRTVAIETTDGYSVTVVHLGSIGVQVGAAVAEGATVGSIGPSGDAEHAEPYVHLGI